ncbi:MAG TPA: GEVED domain-containing protein [Gaiellaceae bacterium]
MGTLASVRRWFMVVVGALLLSQVASGAFAADKDFGDAPDGAPYRGEADIVARFPSLEASNGARHVAAGRLRLGRRVDREAGSRQVDRDRHDDGFFADLDRCRVSELVFLVDARRLPAALRSAGHTAYLNAWFDWNRDGDWEDTDRCGEDVPEHRVVNVPLDMASFARRPVQAIRVRARAGRQVREIWYRASLTFDELFTSPFGTGLFQHGETEDYGPRPEREAEEKRKKFTAGCDPNPSFISHDRPLDVSFRYTGVPPRPSVKLVSKRPEDVAFALKPGGAGFRVRGKEDRRPAGEVAQKVTFKFRFTRGNRTIGVACEVTIYHAKVKKKRPDGIPVPPIERPPTQPGIGRFRETIVLSTPCPPNATINREYKIDIPADAKNPTHRFLHETEEQDLVRPFCPGSTETPEKVEIIPSPSPGQIAYRITLTIKTTVGSPERRHRVRVKFD